MQPRQHKTASFLSAHPIFTRAEFAAAFGHPPGAANVTSLLCHHLRAGNIKRVSRDVFAAVPAHLAADRMVIDRFAAASKLRTDGVLGFHSALELHGIVYSEFNEVQLISAGRTELVELPFGAYRFVTPPKALVTGGKVGYLTTTMDRQGVAVRVTAVERTFVDVLHRPELAGGVEEVLNSLDLVRHLAPAKVADYVELLDNRSIASVSGSWLEKRRDALGVTDKVLARLRARLHDRSTSRWAPNLVMPHSSNRGACFSRRRPSTSPLKAFDGRLARNPSRPCGRAATPACDAGARDSADRHSRRLRQRRTNRATHRLERRHGAQRFPFRSGRLSVDIDVNYVGAIEKEQMDADRPGLEDRIVRLMGSKGYPARRGPRACGRQMDLPLRLGGRSAGRGPSRSTSIISFAAPFTAWIACRRRRSDRIERRMCWFSTSMRSSPARWSRWLRAARRAICSMHITLSLCPISAAQIKVATLMIGASAKSFDWRTASPYAIAWEVGDITGKLTICMHDRYFDAFGGPVGWIESVTAECREKARTALSANGRR
jgi:predicted transcriptional regulator of viral defense system